MTTDIRPVMTSLLRRLDFWWTVPIIPGLVKLTHYKAAGGKLRMLMVYSRWGRGITIWSRIAADEEEKS